MVRGGLVPNKFEQGDRINYAMANVAFFPIDVIENKAQKRPFLSKGGL